MTDLPRGWTEADLGDLCLSVSKVDPRKRPDERFTYIDIGGVEGLRIAQTKDLRGDEAPSRARQLVRAGDTVLSTVRTYLRKTALVPPELDCAVASTGFCVLRPAAFEPRYLFYRVTAHDFVSRITPLQTGSSYPAIRDRDVLAQSVKVPPLNEQRRIVAAIEEHLSRLDAADASLAVAARRLKPIRQTTLIRTLGGGWPAATVGDVAKVTSGPAFKSAEFGGPGEGIPLLRGENIEPGSLRWRDTRTWPKSKLDGYEHLFVQSTDLILGMDRPVISAGLKLAPVRERDLPALLVQRVARIRPTERVMSPFLHATLQLPRFIPHLISDQTGTQLPHITLAGIRSFEIPLPPLEEQRRIVAEVEERLSAIDALRAAIERAQRRSAALRRAVLERAFRGELVPQDPSDEPADTLLARIRAEAAIAAKPAGR
jgi:type I restriction enzyme S subunit